MKEGLAILIVEDCSVMQSVIKKTLSLIGLPISRIDSATNGVEGLKLIKNHIYDIIMVDINMPEMDGMEMIENLKNYSKTVNSSVIVVSADLQKSKRDFIESQNIEFIPKPFKPEELRSKLLEVTKSVKHK